MISKTEIGAWWDAVRLRAGWSYRIGKWKWVLLQALIPAIFAASALTLFNAGRWTIDQNEGRS